MENINIKLLYSLFRCNVLQLSEFHPRDIIEMKYIISSNAQFFDMIKFILCECDNFRKIDPNTKTSMARLIMFGHSIAFRFFYKNKIVVGYREGGSVSYDGDYIFTSIEELIIKKTVSERKSVLEKESEFIDKHKLIDKRNKFNIM